MTMASPSILSLGPLRIGDVVTDSNPTNGLLFRSMLKELDNGLGERDIDKLKYLCQDLGVAPRKFESMKRGIHLFAELEKLALVSADDISLLLALMKAIHRFDLTKKLSAWSAKEGSLAQNLSEYRLLMLRISDSLSRDEREQLKFYLNGPERCLPVSVFEESKTLLQLFIQMEKYMLIGPNNLNMLCDIMKYIGNMAIAKEIQKYQVSVGSSSQTDTSKPFTTKTYQQPAPVGYQGTLHHQQQQHQQHQQQGQFVSHTQSSSPTQAQQPLPPYPTCQRQSPLLTPDQLMHGGGVYSTSPRKPDWYFEALEKRGQAYAEHLWEMFSSTPNEELQMKMKNLQITRATNAPYQNRNTIKKENMDENEPPPEPEPDTEPGPADQGKRGSTRDQRTREPLQDSIVNHPGPRVIPAQTASVVPQTVRDPSSQRQQPTWSMPRYRMNRLPRGLCIIFNAKSFIRNTHLKLSDREGTDKDVEHLLNTFQNRLGFMVHVQNNPTVDDYLRCLKELQGMDHTSYDCFACVILTHGCKGHVYGVDCKNVEIDALTGLFRGAYCKSLAGKPKLFFIQACQGEDSQQAIEIQQDKASTVPNESDMLISLSTVPGYSSNRSVSQGSWYISTMCHVFNMFYKDQDLLSMLTLVNQKMSDAADKANMKQIGMPSYTLRKQVFFNEGQV